MEILRTPSASLGPLASKYQIEADTSQLAAPFTTKIRRGDAGKTFDSLNKREGRQDQAGPHIWRH